MTLCFEGVDVHPVVVWGEPDEGHEKAQAHARFGKSANRGLNETDSVLRSREWNAKVVSRNQVRGFTGGARDPVGGAAKTEDAADRVAPEPSEPEARADEKADRDYERAPVATDGKETEQPDDPDHNDGDKPDESGPGARADKDDMGWSGRNREPEDSDDRGCDHQHDDANEGGPDESSRRDL